jgi:small subunit ribosomal protein S6
MSTATETSKGTEAPRAREYETIYVLRGSVDPDAARKVAERVATVVEGAGAKLVKLDNWGRRRLAYAIAGSTRGTFVHVRYVGTGTIVTELERNLGLFDEVVRCQSVLVRRDVAFGDYEVNPEDVKYRHTETDVPDEEPGIAQRLGLLDRAPPARADDYVDAVEPNDDARGEDMEDET